MLLVQNLKYHDYSFDFATPVGKWRWTVRLDVSQSAPVYSVRDIISPYGLLRDSIPIPGTIIQAMSNSISELNANFLPKILVGPPSQLTFEVDEGFGFASPESVLLTNEGVYGSILSASLTSSAPFMVVSPSTIGNLAINETGSFNVEVDSTNLLAVNSPYAETITIQDPTAINSPQVFPVQIVVRPKATIAFTPGALVFNVVRPLDGHFPIIPTQSFILQNSGPIGSVLNYDIRALTGLCSNWLVGWLPSDGSLPSGQTQSITVNVQPSHNLLQGLYREKLRVSGYSTNKFLDIEIQLVIS